MITRSVKILIILILICIISVYMEVIAILVT